MDENQLSFLDANLKIILFKKAKYIKKPEFSSQKKTYIDYLAEGVARGVLSFEDASLSLLKPNRFGDFVDKGETQKLKHAINRLKKYES